MNSPSEKYINRKQLAERWGIEENTLAKWDINGLNVVPSYKFNRVIRYKESEVIAAENKAVWHRPVAT